MQARQSGLAEYLVRLHSQLDTATLAATLGLMICESRAAIRKQRGLIALQRLGGHDTSAAMEHLGELVTREAGLRMAFETWHERCSLGDEDEAVTPPANTVIHLRRW
jgi:hypothetical protein